MRKAFFTKEQLGNDGKLELSRIVEDLDEDELLENLEKLEKVLNPEVKKKTKKRKQACQGSEVSEVSKDTKNVKKNDIPINQGPPVHLKF